MGLVGGRPEEPGPKKGCCAGGGCWEWGGKSFDRLASLCAQATCQSLQAYRFGDVGFGVNVVPGKRVEPVWGGDGWEKVWKRLVSVLVKNVGEKRGSRPQLNLSLVWDMCVRVERVMPGVKPRCKLGRGEGPRSRWS